MRKLLYILLSITILSSINAQSIYYDAIAIKRLKRDAIFGPSTALILEQYYSTGQSDIDLINAINDSLRTNPFLKDYSIMVGHMFLGGAAGDALNSVKGLNVTNFADGLAKFLVKQGKNELNEMFFRRFKAALDNEKFRELKTLFPATLKKLNSIDEDIYQFKQYIPALRNAFEQDLSAIYDNLPKITTLEKYKYLFEKSPELKVIFETSFYFIDVIRSDSSMHVGEILADLDTVFYQHQSGDKEALKNVGTSIRMLNIFSQSLREKENDDDRYWIKTDSIKKNFVNDDMVTFRIYMGLIYQRIPKELAFHKKDGESILVREQLKKLARAFDDFENKRDSINSVKEFVINLSSQIGLIDNYVQVIKNQSKLKKVKQLDEVDYTNYYLLYTAIIDLIYMGDQIDNLPYLEVKVENPVKEYASITSSAGELYLNVNKKEYVSAVLNMVDIMEFFLDEFTELELEVKNSRKMISKFKTYGTFMANVVKAEDPDAVQAALETASSSSGGSSEKRNSSWNIALNGYIGADFFLCKKDSLPARIAKGRLGITAPVGLTFSKALFKRSGWGTSLSIFVSLIDVGSIAQYRINNDSTAITSEIKLEHIISPGFNVVLGIPKTPISLGYGYQMGPILGRIEDPNNIEVGSFDDRFKEHFFIAIDIPIWNILTIKD